MLMVLMLLGLAPMVRMAALFMAMAAKALLVAMAVVPAGLETVAMAVPGAMEGTVACCSAMVAMVALAHLARAV